MFDAGALIYRIQVIGAEQGKKAIQDQDQALGKAGSTAKQTATATEELGKKTDETSKKQRQSKSDTEALGGSQKRTTESTKTLGQELSSMSEKGQQAAKEVGAGMLGVGAAVSVMVGAAVAKFSSFSGELAQVQTLAHADTEQMHQLSEAALTMGQNIGLSANQVAEAETELVKAGVDVEQQLGGALSGALNLASAGQIDVAKSTQIAAVAMTQFKLAGQDVPHLADLLAAGADKALGGVDDLGMALNQSGLVASQFGLTIEDTVGTLSAFANAGLLGSDAGTSFKTMLLSLASPSTQATELMKKYNIEAYDAQGNFIGITALAGKLSAGLKDASQAERDHALSVIFGTDAIRAANVLYKEGADGIQGWVDKVDDSGFAAEQAQGKLNSLEGDVGKLGAAFDTAMIRTGSGANDVLRDMVQTLTQVVQWYSSLPEPVQAAALAIGVGTAATALFGGTLLVAVPKIVQFRVAVATLSAEFPGTIARAKQFASFLTGPWGVALAAAALGVQLLSQYLDSLQASSDEMTNSLKTAKDAADIFATAGKGKDFKWLTDVKADLKDLPDVLQAAADQSDNVFARFDDRHFGAFDALKQVGESLSTLAQTDLPAAQHAFSLLADETDGSQKELWRLLNTMPAYKDALTAQATEMGINVTSADEAANKHNLLSLAMENSTLVTASNAETTATAASAYQDAADQATSLTKQIDELIESIDKANGVGQDAVTTNATYQQALADVADTIQKAHEGAEGYSTSLDQSTSAGAKNASMFADLAEKSQAAAKAQYDLDHNTDSYRANLVAGRQALIDQITALTGNRDAAAALADQIYRIPSEKEFKLLADTQPAQQAINSFVTTNDGKRLRMYVDAYGGQAYQVPGTNVRFNAEGAVYPRVEAFAGGGIREHHVAQIAKAGTMRVWAEAETGGEAYIPLAEAKRARSTAILQSVATQFGYQLVPTAAASFGDGGTSGSATRSSGLRIQGTLDLGNGLTGLIDGIVHDALDAERRIFDNGSRPGA
ncbi:phage tail tape measure protein [Leifsonia sp. ZF2019]|uniref:phage tail tape measure protein n=1 Tax=Leifsonia sp. ZF2019 TaxID=2781978 RepID=UPI001CBC9EF8|nr:phage tail tape measure protein [Leifsonia sp. ZF2019]UAJ80149.1 phage tail tape measure protein [Leifsonia sp. ZF2019]